MHVTQQQIAKHLGLNQRTVSAAFGGSGRLNPETRRLILEAAEQMGYRPNRLASALRGSKSKSIGVVWPFVEPWAGDSAIGLDVLERLQRQGFATYQSQGSSDVAVLCQQLDDLLSRRVDAIVLRAIPTLLRHPAIAARLRSGPGVVAVTREPVEGFAGDVVVHDRYQAIRQVVEHFAKTGRRRPAIALEMAEESNPPKFEMFRQACAAAGIADHPHLLIPMDVTTKPEEHGQLHLDALRRAFPSKVEVDAVFCFNDIGALCVMRELLDRGLRVPNDVAVVGFNNTEAARIWRPALASADRKMQSVSEALERMVEKRLAEPGLPSQRETVHMEFVWRESAG